MNNETLMVAFVALTGIALLAQAVVMLAMFLLIRKTTRSMQTDLDDLRSNLMPILAKSKELVDHLSPRVESIATDLAALASALRAQGEEFQASTSEILERVNRQTSRVDSMFTTVVDGVDHAGTFVVETVSRPLRQLSAYVASAKAFLGALVGSKHEPSESAPVSNQDLFV